MEYHPGFNGLHLDGSGKDLSFLKGHILGSSCQPKSMNTLHPKYAILSKISRVNPDTYINTGSYNTGWIFLIDKTHDCCSPWSPPDRTMRKVVGWLALSQRWFGSLQSELKARSDEFRWSEEAGSRVVWWLVKIPQLSCFKLEFLWICCLLF